MKQFRKLTWAVIASMSLFSACSNVDDEKEDGPKDPIIEVGTESNPYTVAKLLELTYGSNSDTVARGVWVEAYIVGDIEQFPLESDPEKTENKPVFVAPFASDANILIADMAGTTAVTECANVQIKGYNTKVGLKSVPGNLGKKIKMKGDLRLYNNLKGVLNLKACFLDGNSLDGGAITPGVIEVCGDVTPVASYSYDFEDVVDFEDFNTEGWQNVLISGQRLWKETIFTNKTTGNVEKYIQASAHNAAPGSHEMWAISPALDLTKSSSKTASFKLAKAYLKETTLFEIYALQCVEGKTVQTKLDVTLPTSAADHTFVPTVADLSAFNGTVFIGFRYKGEGGSSNSTTWRIDDFQFGSEISQETTVAIKYGTAAVEINTALNCEITTTVTNAVGTTTITAEGVPTWANFADNGDGTASITGTAPAAAEESTITIKAVNNNVEASKTFTLKVTAPIEAGANIVMNGSFENWTAEAPENWNFNGNSNNKGSFVKETTIVNEGSIAGKFTEKYNLTAEAIILEPGTYTFSYDYYVESSSSTSTNSLRLYGYIDPMDDTTAEDLASLKTLIQSNDRYVPTDEKGKWKTLPLTLEVPKKCKFTITLRSYAGFTGYVDNVVLKKN